MTLVKDIACSLSGMLNVGKQCQAREGSRVEDGNCKEVVETSMDAGSSIVFTIAASQDGKLVVSVIISAALMVWNAETHQR